jgi:hypothetical protein
MLHGRLPAGSGGTGSADGAAHLALACPATIVPEWSRAPPRPLGALVASTIQVKKRGLAPRFYKFW